MAYIGNTAASRFVSNRAASVYSGDGSTVAFTLEQVVTQDEDILVSVDGVIQEPSVGYAVSSGTTLTFTAAPSTNSGNNIFVYYLASQAGTVGHPSTQGLTATTGTFSGNTTVAGDVTIGDASAADKKILFDGNAQDYHIGLDDSTDSLTIGLGSALGTTTHMKFDSTGAITKPLQPAFHATKNNTDQSNVATGGETVVWAAEHFDQNADFDLGNNRFVAPVTGRYFFNISMRLGALDTAANFYSININTSNRSYDYIFAPKFTADLVYYSVSYSIFADMDASDTANIIINQNAGTAQTDIIGSIHYTHFSGYLVA